MSSIRRVVGNAASLLTSDVVSRATTFVLYALVARFLGAFEFGQISLALTLFYVFQVLAIAGLKTLVTREVAKDPAKTDQYLVNGSAIAVISFLLALITLLFFIRLMNYTTDTAHIILLLSLGLLPYSLSAICEAVFQARERMLYIAYTNLIVNTLKIGLALLLLSRGYGLYHLILLLLGSYVLTASLEWGFMTQYITRPRLRLNFGFASDLMRATGTFLGIDSLIAIMSSLNILILSKLANETEVALYSAAMQVMVPVTLVYQSIVLSVFPIMCQRFDSNLVSLKRISTQVLTLLLVITLPTVTGLFFLADAALSLLYGTEDFLQAADVLRIIVWNLILTVLTSVLGQVLVASLREKATLRIVFIDTLIGLVFGLFLIARFGLVGAALTALLMKIVDFLQHYMATTKLLSKLALGRLAWKPAVASICMAVYLAMMKDQAILLTVVSAAVIYLGVLLGLEIWSVGGARQLKAKYLYLWPE